MQHKPRRPLPPQDIAEPTIQEPLLPVTCRCKRTIFVERRDVTETHRCPSCAARFTIVNHLDAEGNAVATPQYVEDAPKPSRPAPQYPAPPPTRPPAPADATLEPPPKRPMPPIPAPKVPPTPQERLRLSEILPPNGAIREFLNVLNDENVDGSPLQEAAAKALVRLASRSVPFLTANLMAGPIHGHSVTMACLRDINDASAVAGLVEYARSLKGIGQDDLKEEAEELAMELMKQGK